MGTIAINEPIMIIAIIILDILALIMYVSTIRYSIKTINETPVEVDEPKQLEESPNLVTNLSFS